MKLEIVKFIESHDNWEDTLPKNFNIAVKRNKADTLVMLDYRIGADFSNPMVRECRGLILENKTWKVVRMAFTKFGNYGESYVPEIDWDSARVQTKIDGSLISVFNYKGIWRVATNGSIDAFEVECCSQHKMIAKSRESFGELFLKALQSLFPTPAEESSLFWEKLNPNYVYTFELTSPETRIVVKYDKPEIHHIGTRDLTTLKELEVDIGVPKPKEWELHSLQDCISFAEKFKGEQEGFVAVDKNWNRVKIKSPFYILAHHTTNNEVSLKDLCHIFLNKETEEFLNYYPEYEKYFYKIKDEYSNVENECMEAVNYYKENNFKLSDIFPDLKTKEIGKMEKFIFRKVKDSNYDYEDYIEHNLFSFEKYFLSRLERMKWENL